MACVKQIPKRMVEAWRALGRYRKGRLRLGVRQVHIGGLWPNPNGQATGKEGRTHMHKHTHTNTNTHSHWEEQHWGTFWRVSYKRTLCRALEPILTLVQRTQPDLTERNSWAYMHVCYLKSVDWLLLLCVREWVILYWLVGAVCQERWPCTDYLFVILGNAVDSSIFGHNICISVQLCLKSAKYA